MQAQDFGFDEDAALLQSSARRLLTEALPTAQLHQQVASDSNAEAGAKACWDDGLWRQMQALGWHLLAIPEAQGGVDMPLAAVAGLMEEIGRAALPSPLPATLACVYVLRACGVSADNALKAIADGASATVAIVGDNSDWSVEATPFTVRDGRLYGTGRFVQDAAKADYLLLCGAENNARRWYWLDAKAQGVRVVGDAIVDLTRDQASLIVDGVEAQCVGEDARASLHQSWPALWTLLAADMVGAGEWQLQTTAEYARTRQQFDRPLGFFQAIKHALVDVMCAIDQAKSLTYAAACAFDQTPHKAHQYARMAKACASDMAAFASSRSVQYHGGIGFTWECYLHLYFKRQKHSQMLYGDTLWHRQALAQDLFDKG